MTPKADRDQLRVDDLHAFYGESHILHGVDLVALEEEREDDQVFLSSSWS